MQHVFQKTVALFALVPLLLATPVLADSSSALSTSSTAIGSLSTSVEKSSDSSSGKKQVAQGHYTLVAMAPLEHQPDTLRLHLVAATSGATAEIALLVPRRTADQAHLAIGRTIAAEHRPYGLALATVTTEGDTSAFFLVLADEWWRELESRPVLL